MRSEKMNVLVLEDSKSIMELLCMKLESCENVGPIECVITLQQAKEKHSRSFDIVFCDLLLPDSEGSHTIKEMSNGSALFVITDYADSIQKVREYIEAGAHLVLPKKDALVLTKVGWMALLECGRAIKKSIDKRNNKLEKLQDILLSTSSKYGLQ